MADKITRAEGEHTPGPWQDTGLPVNYGSRYINEGNGFAIARIFMRQDKRVANEAVIAEMTANAKLIAAAPDMLCALEAARDDFNSIMPPELVKRFGAARLLVQKAIESAS